MNEYGVVLESGAVRFERLLPGPVERVWSYLTQSEKRGTWLASGQIEPRVWAEIDILLDEIAVRAAAQNAEKDTPET